MIRQPTRSTLFPYTTHFRSKENDNIGLFRDSIDARERAELKELANTSLKKELQENKAFTSQLTDAAKHKARQYFESLFGEKGYSAVIDFKSL